MRTTGQERTVLAAAGVALFSMLLVIASAQLTSEEASAGAIARISAVAAGLIVVPGLVIVSYRALRRRRRRAPELGLAREEKRLDIDLELIGRLSDELRNPLAGIYDMALSLTERDVADPELTANVAHVIVDQAAELSRRADDLLIAAKLAAGDIVTLQTEVDPEALVKEVLAPFRLSRTIPGVIDPAIVMADPVRVAQVLRNLVSNAVEHGGSQIGVVGRSDSGAYLISVVDDGPGVPVHLERQVLQRCKGAESAAVSGGLGLCVAGELMRRMEGELSYDRSGRYTSFTVRLPVAAEAQRSSGVAPAGSPREVEFLEPVPVAVDAETLVDEILVPFRASHPITAVVDAATVVADRLHLEQVLRYLVLNSAKHGGSQIGVVGRRDGANYVFSVVDNGLREKDHPRDDPIHVRGPGESRSQHGPGELSLAIVGELARRMESDVSQTRVDAYTAFTVCVPLANDVVEPVPEMRKAG